MSDIPPTNLLRIRPAKGMGANAQIAKNFERLSIAAPGMTGAQLPSVQVPGAAGFGHVVAPQPLACKLDDFNLP